MIYSEEYRVWYKTSTAKGTKIQPVKITEMSTDFKELKLWNKIASNRQIVQRRSLRINYFETKTEAKDYLFEYWSDRVKRKTEELRADKKSLNAVKRIKIK